MILHLIPEKVDGCSYHRIEVPMHNLKGFDLAQSTVLDGVDDESLKKISLVVFSRDSVVSDVTGQIERLNKFKIPYVVDIDDYWKLNKEHLAYKGFKEVTRVRLEQLMKGAAAVTTTSARLAAKIKNHNNNVVVIPNALMACEPQWHYKQRPVGDPVFGWVGGTHHLSDIELLLPCFKEVHQNGQLTLALGGWSLENEVFHIYEHWMSAAGRYKKYKRIKGESVYNYGHIYDFMDVCLVPLLESKFTACKSPLKLIEAGFKSKACIVSRVAPYTDDFTDKEVLFVDDKAGWYPAMQKLYKNPNLLFDYKEALSEKVQQFEIGKVNHIREQLYTTILNGK